MAPTDFEDLDDDEELDENEELRFWDKKQRELVTTQVDYNLSTLKQLAASNDIDLKPKFQRRNRWDVKKKSALIESLLLNVPVPPIYLNEDKFGKYSIIDGKQRVSTVHDFLSNDFALEGLSIFSDINNLRFRELPLQIQTILRTRPTLRAIIILRQSDPDIKHEVFQRLNTGGVPLNPQEIRNNLFAGKFNDRINDLGASKDFHSALGITKKSKIYEEMRDSELVLRFMTFADTWETFNGGVRRQMDNFMEKHKNAKTIRVAEFETRFRTSLHNVIAVFDDTPFKRWMPEKGTWRNQPLASLYDAQMLGMQHFVAGDLIENKAAIVKRFKQLTKEQGFSRSINAATNTPSYLKYRVKTLRGAIEEIL